MVAIVAQRECTELYTLKGEDGKLCYVYFITVLKNK